MTLIIPTADRLPPTGSWTRHTPPDTPGSGRPYGIARSRPGGSDNRFIIDTTTYGILDTPNNAGTIINTAWVDAQNHGNAVVSVPEGEFRLDTNVNGGTYHLFSAGVIVRGAGQGRTIFKGVNSFIFGDGSLGAYFGVTSGPIAKGATQCDVDPGTITAGDVGKNMRFTWQDQKDHDSIIAGAIPVFSTEGLQNIRSYTVRITSVSGNTVHFQPPMYYQADANLWTVVQVDYWSAGHNYIGLEDFTMDAEGTASYGMIQFDGCYGAHLYNIGLENFAGNYSFIFVNCVRPEVRGCYMAAGTLGSSNHSGLLSAATTGLLVEDNVLDEQTPCVEQNHSDVGSVFVHNFVNGRLNTNHSPHNSYGLVARNITGEIIFDGYFGGAENYTITQNWSWVGITMRRFSFRMNLLRNITQNHGDITNPFWNWETSNGLASIVGQWDGESEFFADDFPMSWPPIQCTLLTRESENTGVFTVVGAWRVYDGTFKMGITQAGGGPGGFNDGNYIIPIESEPVGSGGLTKTTKWRMNMTFVLPPEGTVFDIWGPGAIGWEERNMDVAHTAWAKGNFTLQTGGGGETGYPVTNPIDEVNDVCAEFLGDDTAPDGSSIDVVDWGTCPWHGSGNGFINPANPSEVAKTDIPAGKAYFQAIASNFTTNLTGSNNDLVFTSRAKVLSSNLISIQYVDPGVETDTEIVTRNVRAITVTLRRVGGVLSTSAQVKAAIEATASVGPDANDLVIITHAAGNNGSGSVTAMAPTNLSGADVSPIYDRLNVNLNKVATPTLLPAEGNFTTAQNVQILDSTADPDIHYTLNDTEATISSPSYTGPIPLSVPSVTVIRTRAFHADMEDSNERRGTYTLTTPSTFPNAPSGLNALGVSSSQIDLIWTDNSSDELSFLIKHGLASGSEVDLTTVAAGVTTFQHLGLSPSTTHFYRVVAIGSSGGDPTSTSAEASGTTLGGATVPSAPSGIIAVAVSPSQINLTWVDNSNNETGFEIYHRLGTNPDTLLFTTAANVVSYSHLSLTPGSVHYYNIRAINGSGASAFPPEATATTPGEFPNPPTNVVATGVSSSQINLSWTDNSTNEQIFVINHGTVSGTLVPLANVPANVTTFPHGGLNPSETHFYSITAVGASGSGPLSTSVVFSGTTLAPAITIPTSPSGLTAGAVSSTTIHLNWMDNSNNETGFEVHEGSATGSVSLLFTTGAGVTSFDHILLDPSSTHYYQVRAINSAGASSFAPEANATTPVAPGIPPTVTGPVTASGVSGTAFSFHIEATGQPTSYGASGLPHGLLINGVTGDIYGTIYSAGVWVVTITATNTGGTGQTSLTITIVDPTPGTSPVVPTEWRISGTITCTPYEAPQKQDLGEPVPMSRKIDSEAPTIPGLSHIVYNPDQSPPFNVT